MKIKIEREFNSTFAEVGQFVGVRKLGDSLRIDLDKLLYWCDDAIQIYSLTPVEAVQLQDELRIAVLLCQRLVAESNIESLNEVTIV